MTFKIKAMWLFYSRGGQPSARRGLQARTEPKKGNQGRREAFKKQLSGFGAGESGRPGTGRFSGQPAVATTASIFSTSAFRDMNGVGKLPSVNPGTPSTVVRNSYRLHLIPVNSRLHSDQSNPIRCHGYWNRPGACRYNHVIASIMQESRYLRKMPISCFIPKG
jgi:hypothetical protein